MQNANIVTLFVRALMIHDFDSECACGGIPMAMLGIRGSTYASIIYL